jgi:ech hydrogenase subunit A
MGSLSCLTALTCLLFPMISSYCLEPYIARVYGATDAGSLLGGPANLIIMLMMLGMIALFPLSFVNYSHKIRVVDPYLGGANLESDGSVKFQGSAGATREMSLTNYYMAELLGEKRVFRAGVSAGAVLLFAMLFLVLIKPV